jgi:hypothetical protein
MAVVKTQLASIKFEVSRLVIYLTNYSVLVQLTVTEKFGSCPVLRPYNGYREFKSFIRCQNRTFGRYVRFV